VAVVPSLPWWANGGSFCRCHPHPFTSFWTTCLMMPCVRMWRRRSWIHFLVSGDGGAGVFLVAHLTKFLVVQGFIVTRWGTVKRPVMRLGTCVRSGDSWPQRKHVVTRRRVIVQILFKYQIPNYEFFVFLLIFRWCFMCPNESTSRPLSGFWLIEWPND
jgi:hypothetical protein